MKSICAVDFILPLPSGSILRRSLDRPISRELHLWKRSRSSSPVEIANLQLIASHELAAN